MTILFQNKILRSLDPQTIERLHLRRIELPVAHQIERPGEDINHLVFIEEGIGSMTSTFCDGFKVDVGMFGTESVMGGSALVGSHVSLNTVYMQIGGYGFSCRTDSATVEFSRLGEFHDLVLRYQQAMLVQAFQSVGCNSHHTIPQRLSRCLLLFADRFEFSVIALTHEYLANALGSSRTTISVAAESFQRQGLIRYSRGKISILNRSGLEQRSCECYRIVKNHLDGKTTIGMKT